MVRICPDCRHRASKHSISGRGTCGEPGANCPCATVQGWVEEFGITVGMIVLHVEVMPEHYDMLRAEARVRHSSVEELASAALESYAREVDKE